MIKAFIFDMDGVIVNSEPAHLRSFNHALTKCNIQISADEFQQRYMGYPDLQICDQIIAGHKLTLSTEEFLSEKRRAYLQELRQHNIEPITGIVETTKEINNLMPIAIASSSEKSEIEIITEYLGIRELFSALVSTNEVENGKPAPDVYLRAAKLMGVDPTACGVIEDTPLGIRAAKQAGMYCVGITTTHDRTNLYEADAIIDSLNRLVPTIINLVYEKRM